MGDEASSSIEISEKVFRADPAKAVRDACSAPVVVVDGRGRARLVIVRQRKPLSCE